jgi:hypothetical protein
MSTNLVSGHCVKGIPFHTEGDSEYISLTASYPFVPYELRDALFGVPGRAR